jgi:hypothetical protein
MRIRNRSAGYPKSIAAYCEKHFKSIVLTVLIVITTLTGLTLVGISPIALRSLANIHGVNWAKLSNVGQAYGTISALLVVLGLSGVAITVLLQVRESRHGRVQAARNRQHDLVKMAMDDPAYMAVMGPGGNFDERRQTSYANLWIQFWLMLWEFGDLSEAELRKVLARELFGSTAGRSSWERFRSVRIRDFEKKKDRRFYDILDQEYSSMVSGARAARAINPDAGSPGRAIAVSMSILAAAIAHAILCRVRRRRHDHRSSFDRTGSRKGHSPIAASERRARLHWPRLP